MSGIYNYHANVAHPGAFLNNQMASQQAPFFMGGSQVPVGLNLTPQYQPYKEIGGSGFKPTTHHLLRRRREIIPSSEIRK